MPEPETLEIIRAVVDTIAPATGDLPGGVATGAHDHIVDLIEIALPGSVDMGAMLVNAYAAEVRPGATFIDLTPDERNRVISAMSTDESQDIREVIDTLIVFALGGTFSEWSGYDRTTRALKPPKAWDVVGFHGPSHGHPNYRVDV